MLDPEHKFAFVHIPKCGGTSIERVMLKRNGLAGVPWRDLGRDLHRKHLIAGPENWQHLPLHRIEKRTDLTGWQVLALTRDPVDRAISEFAFQLAGHTRGKRFGELGAYRLKNFNQAVQSGLLWRACYRWHAESQKFFIMRKTGKFSLHLVRLEEADAVVPRLWKKIFGESLELEHADTTAHLLPGPFEIENQTLWEIWERWGGDYEACGYEIPEMLSGRPPRIVWMYWASGWGDAPRVAKASARSWRTLNPGWEVRLLDDSSQEVAEARPMWEGKKMSITAQSDLLRLHLLEKYGGVWADATVLCMRPLAKWFYEAVRPAGMFLFRNHPVASWFIGARPGHPAIREWRERAKRYWEGRSVPDRYLWLHRLIGDMLNDGWLDKMPWIDASAPLQTGPHILCRYKSDANGRPGLRFFPRLIEEQPPMLKMTWKVPIAPDSKFDLLVRSLE